jgi:hypothetical protein
MLGFEDIVDINDQAPRDRHWRYTKMNPSRSKNWMANLTQINQKKV